MNLIECISNLEEAKNDIHYAALNLDPTGLNPDGTPDWEHEANHACNRASDIINEVIEYLLQITTERTYNGRNRNSNQTAGREESQA